MSFRLLLSALFVLVQNIFCFGQEPRYQVKETVQATGPGGTKEGRYTCFFDGKQLAEGKYEHDKKSGEWKYFDYGGTLIIQGGYSDGIKEGPWKYMHSNGKIKCEINYLKGEKHGLMKGFYEDGTLAVQGIYRQGDKDSLWLNYDKQGNLREKDFYHNTQRDSIIEFYSTGEVERKLLYSGEDTIQRITVYFKNKSIFYDMLYKNDWKYQLMRVANAAGEPLEGGSFSNGNGTLITYYEPYDSTGAPRLSMRSKATYVNGIPNGSAEIYDEEGKVLKKGSYQKGYKVGIWMERDQKGEKTEKDYESLKSDTLKDKDPYELSMPIRWEPDEKMPEFPGGQDVLLKYLGSIVYPKYAKQNDIEGSVYIRFVVDQVGEVTNVEVAKGAAKVLNEAAVEHVKKMPPWTPGFQNMLPVKVQYVVPIKFLLQ